MASKLYYDQSEGDGGNRILLATPSYENPDASYTYSVARSLKALNDAGFDADYLLLEGNCHVDDARNVIVRHFRESTCRDLVFLDADVSWEPEALLQLCQHDLDVVGAIYPFRGGAGQNMPMRLMDTRYPDKDGMLELEGLPTGFLKIRKAVFDKLEPHVPWYWDKTERTPQFFTRDIHADNQRWGGDIEFCKRWRDIGGKIFADTEIRLGHAKKEIVRDSLAAFLRRNCGITLSYIIPMIRDGVERRSDYDEIQAYTDDFASDAELLFMLVNLARQCRAPIIETGSGISSVLQAVANAENEVWSLESSPHYLNKTCEMAQTYGASNLHVLHCPMKGDWYDFDPERIPHRKFGIGYCDGPPRLLGERFTFFERIAPQCKVVVADDVGTDWRYASMVTEWANANGRSLKMFGRAALII